jgi:hypothetical protein
VSWDSCSTIAGQDYALSRNEQKSTTTTSTNVQATPAVALFCFMKAGACVHNNNALFMHQDVTNKRSTRSPNNAQQVLNTQGHAWQGRALSICNEDIKLACGAGATLMAQLNGFAASVRVKYLHAAGGLSVAAHVACLLVLLAGEGNADVSVQVDTPGCCGTREDGSCWGSCCCCCRCVAQSQDPSR